MKYCIYTYGCKVNRYESEKIDASLRKNGHVPVAEWSEADCFILNGCVVTKKSESSNRRLIRKVLRERPDMTVIAAGCLAERGGFPENVVTVGNSGKVEALLAIFGIDHSEELETFTGRSRAFIKIQDGCEQFCSYCIIPYVRGKQRDCDKETVIDEARRLSGNGYREIVLTGIHVGRNKELNDIIARISALPDVERIRLSSIEINEVDNRLLDMMVSDPKLMHHLHIPLQSGSDAVLDAMNRPYDSAAFMRMTDRIRERVPKIGLTTDLIVGFPGETESDFERSLLMIEYARFHRVHVFPFSPRPGTAAWDMEDRVHPDIVGGRAAKAAEKARASLADYVLSLKGCAAEVLIEDCGDGYGTGYSSEYLRTTVKGVFNTGEIVSVLLDGGIEDGICGCVSEDSAVKEG